MVQRSHMTETALNYDFILVFHSICSLYYFQHCI